MLLYLDDDSVRGVLIRRLRDEGHDVLTPKAAGTAGQVDPVHFMSATIGAESDYCNTKCSPKAAMGLENVKPSQAIWLLQRCDATISQRSIRQPCGFLLPD